MTAYPYIDSGTFHYETLTLPFADSQGIVVQVPDDTSRQRLAEASARTQLNHVRETS
jgi:hypothetical protein